MPCKTKSRENLCLCVRTVRAVTLDSPRPPQFHLEYNEKTSFCEKLDVQFFCSFCCFLDTYPPWGPLDQMGGLGCLGTPWATQGSLRPQGESLGEP